MVDQVCATDGVPVTESRNGTLIHLDELPRGTQEHDIVAVPTDEFDRAAMVKADVKAAAAALMGHHASFHPSMDCPFVVRLAEALRR